MVLMLNTNECTAYTINFIPEKSEIPDLLFSSIFNSHHKNDIYAHRENKKQIKRGSLTLRVIDRSQNVLKCIKSL